MRAAVVDGTRAVLNDAQLARWPSFQRSLRRQKALPMGRLAGESVDLDILLRQIGVKPERIPGLPDTLARYEVELDRALVARDDRLEDARARTMLAMMSRDLEGAVQIANEEAQLREAVRAVNEQYVAALGRLLGGERALDFDQAWRLRAYPGVYEPTPTARAFSTALGLGDLDVQQREVVSLMHELYLEELEPRNAELAAAVRRQERLDIQRRLRRWSGDRADHRADPRPEAERRRAELGDRFRAQLEMVLTPEQAAQLPPPGELDDAPARRGAERPFDRDGDGELSEAEREAAQRQFRPRLRRDRGGSGS